jgi:hypothetical protein
MAYQLHDRFVRRYFQEGRYDISVDDLITVALFVDKAIHVPHRLTAHLLWHRVSVATGFLIKITQRLTWQSCRGLTQGTQLGSLSK